VLSAAHGQLLAYFEGDLQTFDLPLQFLMGTPFQQAVWRALQTIPFSGTTTYGDIAQRIGKPQAVRAVGAAIGRNPWSVVVPCHRVLGANGGLTGYAGGLDRKKHLLALEARISSPI
jgi:methylated-DNA-[protein]-cysteine S-methyltransferase